MPGLLERRRGVPSRRLRRAACEASSRPPHLARLANAPLTPRWHARWQLEMRTCDTDNTVRVTYHKGAQDDKQ